MSVEQPYYIVCGYCRVYQEVKDPMTDGHRNSVSIKASWLIDQHKKQHLPMKLDENCVYCQGKKSLREIENKVISHGHLGKELDKRLRNISSLSVKVKDNTVNPQHLLQQDSIRRKLFRLSEGVFRDSSQE
jgi:hypothetical protein